MERWWESALAAIFAGRIVIVAGAVPTAWRDTVAELRAVGADRIMLVATEGAGVGSGPDTPTVVATPPAGLHMMDRLRWGNAVLQDPPEHIRTAIDEFDPDGSAVVVGTFLNEAPHLAGRQFLAHRRPEWVALEDKTVADDLWVRAGVDHLPSTVVATEHAAEAAPSFDRGSGTVWAADATQGYHGGAHGTRWVADDASSLAAQDDLGRIADRVRIMPFVDGVPCSVHGVVLRDGAAALRPVEMLTLRRDRSLVYAGCASFWDPEPRVRDAMRAVVRRVARVLVEEVDFRGAFTVDGIVDEVGFWPTELNPRLGIGLITIAGGSTGVPVALLNDVAIAGSEVGATAARFEAELLDHADRHRAGGTWHAADGVAAEHHDRAARYDGSSWHWTAEDASAPHGRVTSGAGFARCRFDSETTPVGPSAAPRAAAFWRFAADELGSRLGPLTPAPDRR